MIFTQEQIDEINRRLANRGIRDSEISKIDLVTNPITGEETVVIVKDGENVRISLKDLFQQEVANPIRDIDIIRSNALEGKIARENQCIIKTDKNTAYFDNAGNYPNDQSNATLLGEGNTALGRGAFAGGSHCQVGEWAAAFNTANRATGMYSFATGTGNTASGSNSHAEGKETEARGAHSHAEGYSTVAEGEDSHAEGHETKAKGFAAHVEGKSNGALGAYSHVEGEENIAGNLEDEWAGTCAHAEGHQTKAVGNYAHSEGDETSAFGDASHAEGNNTEARGPYSHAEGHHTITNNKGEHACGRYNVSNAGENDADKTIFSVGIGNNARKNGLEVRENGDVYMWVGNAYTNINPCIANIEELAKSKQDKLVSGINIRTINGESVLGNGDLHLQPTLVGGTNIKTIWGKDILGSGDLIEGEGCTTSGKNAHAEGKSTVASGDYSHAEGDSTQALAISSHTEGCQTKTESVSNNGVKVYYAHAEGNGTIAAGSNSHTEGFQTKTYANNSHAEGHSSEAHGDGSHVEGYGTIAYNIGEHACGRYNESIKSQAATDTEEVVVGTVFSVGIGESDKKRINAIDIREDGRIYIWLNGERVCLQDLLTSTPNQSPLPPQYGVINEVGEEELNNIVDDYLDKEEE